MKRGGPRGRRGPFVRDEFAYVLDYMPYGNPIDRHPQHRRMPVAQAIGSKWLTLVEIEPLPNIVPTIGERVPIATTPNAPGHRVSDRITYADLTTVARENLPSIVRKIVVEKERVFVEFFNVAEPINIRLHSLELLPGVGKKTLMQILAERKKKPFESFEDIQKRVRINDPAKLIVDRIIKELQGGERYYLFVEPYPRNPDHRFLNYLRFLYERVGYRDPW